MKSLEAEQGAGEADQPAAVLSWRVLDASDEAVQGATVRLKWGDSEGSGSLEADVEDNVGQEGYKGADEDAEPGVFRVKKLTVKADDEDETGVDHQVLLNTAYLAKAVKAEGFMAGDDVEWVDLAADAEADLQAEELQKLVLAALSQEAPAPEAPQPEELKQGDDGVGEGDEPEGIGEDELSKSDGLEDDPALLEDNEALNGLTPFNAPGNSFCTAPGVFSVSDDELRSLWLNNVGTAQRAGDSWGGVDALAINTTGTYAYAAQGGNQWGFNLLRWSANESLVANQGWKDSGGVVPNANPAAGAIKRNSNGQEIYYLGYFVSEGGQGGNQRRLKLFAYNLSTDAFIGQIGYVQLQGSGDSTGYTGDIAFDDQGRLLVLFSNSSGNNSRLYRTDAAVPFTTGTGALTRTQLTGDITTPNGTAWNGLAYDTNGALWIARRTSTASNSNSTVAQVNTENGSLSNSSTFSGRTSDLGGCGQRVSRLQLQKNIVSRFNQSDQFKLDIRAQGSATDLAAATTSGSSTGTQSPAAGPMTVTAGAQYVISETGASGANLSNYTFGYTCTWSGGGTLDGAAMSYSAGTGRAQALLNAIPAGKEGQTLNCVITNTAKPANQASPKLVLQKDVKSRVNAQDQFNLQAVRADTGTVIGQTTTTSSGTGVQTPTVTNVTIEAGQAYTISEGAAGTATNLDGYSASYSCTWSNGTEFARGVLSASGGRLRDNLPVIPTGRNGDTLTCTIENTAKPAQGLLCGPDDVYVLDRLNPATTGQAKLVNSTGVSAGTTPPQRITLGTGSQISNALAINLDGSKAISVAQGSGTAGALGTLAMYTWDAVGSGTTNSLSMTRTGEATPNIGWGSLIGGTVDPSSGAYYFGGYNGDTFILFKVLPDATTATGYANTYQYVRSVKVGGATAGYNGNGDIAFDATGNLYLVWSYNKTGRPAWTRHVLARLDSQYVNSSTDTHEAVQIGGDLDGDGTSIYNGITFSGNGELYASMSGKVLRINPTTGARIGFVDGTGTFVDMASCGLPPTMRLQKDVVGGRFAQNDQFKLDILVDKDNGTSNFLVQSGTTTGANLGIQAENAGPVVVTVGNTYTIRESGAGTPAADLGKYISGYSCQWSDEATPTYVGQFTGSNRTFRFPDAIPTGKAGAQLVCTITNEPIQPATVTASKIVLDANGENPRPGVGWNMTTAVTNPSGGTPTLSNPATRSTVDDGSVANPWTVAFPSSASSATLTVSEARQNGYTFVSGTCTVTPRIGVPRTVAVTGAPTASNPIATIPGVVASDQVECEFTNQEVPGSVTWEKADAGDSTGARLAGTRWELSGPSLPDGAVEVADCVAVNDAACPAGPYRDRDSRAGYFRVDGLIHGGYELVELEAPPGYVLDATPHPFTINGIGTAQVSLGSITNEREPGSVTWQKVDDSSPAQHLTGSEWKIAGPLPGAIELPVVDCVADDAADCASTPDKDHRAGYFKVTGLEWGSYQLIETKAPAGYQLDPEPHPFIISSDALNYTFAEGIVNHPRETPNLPLTGGLGRDHFFIAGAVVVIAGGSAALVTQIRRRRKEVA